MLPLAFLSCYYYLQLLAVLDAISNLRTDSFQYSLILESGPINE